VSGTFCAKHPQGEFLAKGTGHFLPHVPFAAAIVNRNLPLTTHTLSSNQR